MSRASRTEWAKRVERWRDSGLTAKEFAAETGLKASTLTYWSWRLSADSRREQAKGGSGTRRSPKPRGKTATLAPKPTFVEVSPVARMTSSAAMLEVVLPGGAIVRVPGDFEEAMLGRVVRALEASR